LANEVKHKKGELSSTLSKLSELAQFNHETQP